MRMKLSLLHRGSDQGLLVCQGGGSLLHNQAHLGGAKEDRRPSRGPTPRSTSETTMVLPDQDQFILTARWYSLPGWCAITATPATARAKRNAAELRIFRWIDLDHQARLTESGVSVSRLAVFSRLR
jgi:hypothetical protein